MDNDTVIAKIRKSAVSEIWIVAKVYQGKSSCDVREYFHPADKDEWLPTRKGVAIPADLVPQAVDAAEELAQKEGLGEVCAIPRGENMKISFGIREFQKHIYAEIRTYYRANSKDKDWKPGKGATLPPATLPQIAEALRLAEDYMS